MNKEQAKLSIIEQFKDVDNPICYLMFCNNNEHPIAARFKEIQYFECQEMETDFVVEYLHDDNRFQVQFSQHGYLQNKYPEMTFEPFEKQHIMKSMFINESIVIAGSLITFSVLRTHLKLKDYVVDFAEPRDDIEYSVFSVALGMFTSGDTNMVLYAAKSGRELNHPCRYGDWEITTKEMTQIKKMRRNKTSLQMPKNINAVEKIFAKYVNKSGSHIEEIIAELRLLESSNAAK